MLYLVLNYVNIYKFVLLVFFSLFYVFGKYYLLHKLTDLTAMHKQ